MKVTGQSSLIAAQQLGVQRTNTEAKAASAAFFAELRKAAPTAATPARPSTAAPVQTNTTTQVNAISTMREAPLRSTASVPLPPGSLLNIVV